MLSSYFSYWRGSRADLLEFLTPSSKELDDLHVSFLRAYENVYMANFFETVPMRLFGLPLYLVSPILNSYLHATRKAERGLVGVFCSIV